MKFNMLLKILIAGDGGQGVQTMAGIISKAVFQNDKHVSFIPNYGLEQRGGASLAFVQISDRDIVYPKFSKPDVLVIMSEQARERTKDYSAATVLDAKDADAATAGSSLNMLFLGKLCKILESEKMLAREEVLNLLEQKLKNKPGWEENKKAFVGGFND